MFGPDFETPVKYTLANPRTLTPVHMPPHAAISATGSVTRSGSPAGKVGVPPLQTEFGSGALGIELWCDILVSKPLRTGPHVAPGLVPTVSPILRVPWKPSAMAAPSADPPGPWPTSSQPQLPFAPAVNFAPKETNAPGSRLIVPLHGSAHSNTVGKSPPV